MSELKSISNRHFKDNPVGALNRLEKGEKVVNLGKVELTKQTDDDKPIYTIDLNRCATDKEMRKLVVGRALRDAANGHVVALFTNSKNLSVLKLVSPPSQKR